MMNTKYRFRSICFSRLYVLLITFMCLIHFSVVGEVDHRSLIKVEYSLIKVLNSLPRDTGYLNMIGVLEQLLIDSPKFLYYAELNPDEQTASLFVEDTGKGIPEDKQGKIVEGSRFAIVIPYKK